MKKITFEDAFRDQIEKLKLVKGVTKKELDISYDDYKKKYNFGKNSITEERMEEMYKNRNVYADGNIKKAGDKLVFYIQPKLSINSDKDKQSGVDEIGFDMVLKGHVLDRINELKNKDFYIYENSPGLPWVCNKGSKESKICREQ